MFGMLKRCKGVCWGLEQQKGDWLGGAGHADNHPAQTHAQTHIQHTHKLTSRVMSQSSKLLVVSQSIFLTKMGSMCAITPCGKSTPKCFCRMGKQGAHTGTAQRQGKNWACRASHFCGFLLSQKSLAVMH
eukprot:scaffold23464_cov19-Tisochrysis_lutea.AAC.2